MFFISLHRMKRLSEEIVSFLEENGFTCRHKVRDDQDILYIPLTDEKTERLIVPWEIDTESIGSSRSHSDRILHIVRQIKQSYGHYPLIITQDRWSARKEMMKARILAHLEKFVPAYARNCEVRRIDKKTAEYFLEENHNYGYSACRYKYGLFLKRHTGHIAENKKAEGVENCGLDTLVAVATFSNARKWTKGEKVIRSYEWTRYASLPGMRISGGMGKLLKAFIKEVSPDDIMTYADLEWSEGDVYSKLGFELEGTKERISFLIDPVRWGRSAIKDQEDENIEIRQLYLTNFGSNKFRMKLTDYQK